MSEEELVRCCWELGVERDVTLEALKKAYLQKSYALIRRGASDEEKAKLREAHNALVARIEAREQRAVAATLAAAKATRATRKEEAALTAAEAEAFRAQQTDSPASPYGPRSFESTWVNVLAPPLVLLAALAIKSSFFAFFLQGFHVWIHEFGHATVAWLTGRRALPLPIGWTNVASEKSWFVYFGILFLLGLLFLAGARERKPWPMAIALLLALVQGYMTWRLPEHRAEMWLAFGGVGGELYLSAAMMALFYVRLPEKFKCGACRYLFLFLGACSFSQTYWFWKKVKRVEEGIPYGSMIHGEEDGGGDMNALRDDYGWTQREIIHTYNHLADACLVVLLVVYLFFALRLDRLVTRHLPRTGGQAGGTSSHLS